MTVLHDMPQHLCDKLIVFNGKAKTTIGRTGGFGGKIIFLDNREHVRPRFIDAKYPRKKSSQSPHESVEAVHARDDAAGQGALPSEHSLAFGITMILSVPVAYFRRWEGDLSALIEDEQLGDEGRLSIMVQLVSGLAHCQARGLVHQDLKPENVFVRDLRRDFKLRESDV